MRQPWPRLTASLSRIGRLALMLAVVASLGACATPANPKDPFEKFNRAMFTFNDTVDQAALKPAATAYKTVVPGFVQTGVGNFFGNLADVWSAVNNLLQGKGQAGMSDVTRVALNSTLGIGGLIDIASDAGLQKHKEDFGQTLGTWGVPSGPYLMLPFLGASTVRDALALPLDARADPWAYKRPVRWRNVGVAVRGIDQRATLLDASNLMEEAALDRYEFIRDSFLQRRDSLIDDGDGPRKKKPGKDDEDGDAKPADAKPAEAADAKPADAKPSDAKPADAKPADAKPADAKAADAKPLDLKADDGKAGNGEAATENPPPLSSDSPAKELTPATPPEP
ncbi:MAG: VacJ family lipoprotein [Pseudomonadota bacterium]